MVAEPRLGCLVGGGREYPAGGSSRVGGCWVRGLGGSAGFSRLRDFVGFGRCLWSVRGSCYENSSGCVVVGVGKPVSNAA